MMVLTLPFSARAAPQVTLTAEPMNDYRSVVFTFVQNDLASMEGCHYNLFAADAAKDLRTLPGKGLSIATFFKASNFIQIIAGPLPHLARNFGLDKPRIRRSVRVYFRTLLSCPLATNGYGQTIYVNMHTYKGGRFRTVKHLRLSMKYHMRYYEPG